MSVWIGSRGLAGKSFLLALLGLTEAVTLGASVNILGGSGEQAKRVHEYMEDFWKKKTAPHSLLMSDPTKRETRLIHGNKIQALMASQASVRGGHPQRLRLDECVAGSTYISTKRGYVSIRHLKVGDEVWTVDEESTLKYGSKRTYLSEVLAVENKGKRRTIVVSFENGEELTCTPEHKNHDT